MNQNLKSTLYPGKIQKKGNQIFHLLTQEKTCLKIVKVTGVFSREKPYQIIGV